MDFNKLACRVLSLLRSPKAEWPKIAAEPAEIASLYTHYILWLAAIGPIFGFIKGSLIGYGALGVHFRQGIGAGIGAAILSYLLALIVIFLMALIVEALAPTFGGQKNRVQALKAVAYGWTAAWVAAIGVVIPWVGWLIMIAGVIYSIYLLYLGLPQTMQCPHGKAAGYTAVSVIIGIVLSWIIGIVVASIFAVGTASLASTAGETVVTSGDGSTISVDPDKPAGAVVAALIRAQQAAKLDSGDTANADGQSAAAAASSGIAAALAVLSGKQGQVESLAPSALKAYAPESLDGLPRVSLSAERQTVMGMQMTEASAEYRSEDGARALTLQLTDSAALSGIMGMARAFGAEGTKQTDHGFSKHYSENGRLIEEEWDQAAQRGRYSITLGDRFKIEVSGDATGIEQLQSVIQGIDTEALAKLTVEAGKR